MFALNETFTDQKEQQQQQNGQQQQIWITNKQPERNEWMNVKKTLKNS